MQHPIASHCSSLCSASFQSVSRCPSIVLHRAAAGCSPSQHSSSPEAKHGQPPARAHVMQREVRAVPLKTSHAIVLPLPLVSFCLPMQHPIASHCSSLCLASFPVSITLPLDRSVPGRDDLSFLSALILCGPPARSTPSTCSCLPAGRSRCPF